LLGHPKSHLEYPEMLCFHAFFGTPAIYKSDLIFL